MNEVKRVVIAGMFRFPYGDAISNRYMALAKSLLSVGFVPLVVGNGLNAANEIDNSKPNDVDGISFCTIRSLRDNFVNKVFRRLFFEYFLGRVLKKSQYQDVAVILVSRESLTLRLLLLSKYLWRKPLIVDCMEWYEPNQFKFGMFSIRYLIFLYKFHILSPLASGVLVVSNLLYDYFKKRGCIVLRLPPQIVSSEYHPHYSKDGSEPINLFYAGNIGRKDDIGVVLQAIAELPNCKRTRIRFCIVGPSWADVNSILIQRNVSRYLIDGVVDVLGKLPRSEVLTRLSQSDFLVLIRPISRHSNAGFPSKVPECLASGTPVISNLTSDLDKFLIDGVNSLIAEGNDVKNVKAVLRRAVDLHCDTISDMSNHARLTAIGKFDYTVQASDLNRFFLECLAVNNA